MMFTGALLIVSPKLKIEQVPNNTMSKQNVVYLCSEKLFSSKKNNTLGLHIQQYGRSSASGCLRNVMVVQIQIANRPHSPSF